MSDVEHRDVEHFSYFADIVDEAFHRLADEVMRRHGCPHCDVLVLGPDAHVCEHGVVFGIPEDVEVEVSVEIDDEDLYRRLMGEGP
jgi:hypothetical protein